MVGAQHVYHALSSPRQIASRWRRRAPADSSARGRRAVRSSRRFEREVVRRRLDRGDVLVVTEELHLLRARDVQDVHPLSGFVREPD